MGRWTPGLGPRRAEGSIPLAVGDGGGIVTFAITAYKDACTYYDNTWKVMDEALYRLCRENPDHARRSSVCAKLWIIGRTYATGIERKVATTGSQGSSMWQVAKHFLSHAEKIDGLFAELRGVAEQLG